MGKFPQCCSNLPQIPKCPKKISWKQFPVLHSPSEALSAAFIETDKAFRKELDFQRPKRKGQGKNWHPGCTAISALFVNDMLIVANAGDCRTILCRNGQAIALSKVFEGNKRESMLARYIHLFIDILSIAKSIMFSILKDHIASSLEERERVIKLGGQVKWQVDTWRVGAAALQVLPCFV